MTTPSTPAGWYPDPDGSGGQRYWDGIGWTEHRYPAATSPEPVEQVDTADESPVGEQPTSVVSLPDQPTTVVPTRTAEPSDPTSDSVTEQPTAAEPFEPPTFESFATPSFESISSGTFESATAPRAPEPSTAPPAAEPVTQASAPAFDTPPFGTPAYDAPPTSVPSFGAPSYDTPSYDGPPPFPDTSAAPTASFVGPPFAGPPPGFSGPPPPAGSDGGGPNNRKLIIGFLSVVGALLLVLILILVYAFVIRDDTATDITSSTPSTSTSESALTEPSDTPSETTTETDAPPPVEGEATEGAFVFSVASTDTGDTVTSPINEYIEKTATGEYIVVYLNVGNTGTSPLTFLSTLQILKADTGTFVPDDEASFYLGGGVVTINPGEVIETAVAFDVPVGTVAQAIEIHGEPGGLGVELPV